MHRCRIETLTAAAILFLSASGAAGQNAPQDGARPIPDSLKRHFSPPAEMAGKFGPYAPVTPVENGKIKARPEDWPGIRTQILTRWHTIMGPWPAVLENPVVETLHSQHRENFTQQRVRLQTAAGQFSEGWLLIPDGPGPFPAVLVVYYEPETSVGLKPDQPHRDYGLLLARRGMVTLSIGSPGGSAWKPDLGNAQCQPLSYHAYVAANAHTALARMKNVAPQRIGIVGHSYGGKWALFAAALWEKFAAVAVSDPGIVFDESRSNINYWEPWYLGSDDKEKRPKAGVPAPDNPRTGAYKRLVAEKHDLHEIHALLAPRPFLVSGGSEDPPERWAALNHLVRLNEWLGFPQRVGMTNRKDHAPDAEANAVLVAFFEHFLKP